jgi:signal transduction histidine kinase
LLDWKNAIPAEQRIREIEEGIEPEFLKVIIDTKEAGNILFNLAKSVKNEALSIMPNAHAMIRMEKLGVVKLLIEASQKGAVVKIICPIREANSRIAKWIFEQAPDIRIMEGCNDAQSGILIVDSKKFLQAEVKNPTADQFSDAIGFAIYSNSKRNINSFKSFFELLWNEGVLNKELKIADKMQKDFINIAAHELRTPIQPILSLTELLHSKIKDNAEECQLLDVVIRNAKRLQRLTEDILDVSRIESNSLVLKKEQFNLDDMISTAAQDYNVGIEKTNGSKLKLIYEPNANRDIIVEADRDRLAQVFANLLDNAVKFTKEGTIYLSMERKVGHAIISLKDTGIGIDPQILPRLFTKFTTKSYEGTGLGLYISKSIVEAHGGRIWAENNKDGKGATFTFTLPIIKSINLT